MIETNKEEQDRNYVDVTLKRSSTSGKCGWDIKVHTNGTITEDILTTIAEKAVNTALKADAGVSKVRG